MLLSHSARYSVFIQGQHLALCLFPPTRFNPPRAPWLSFLMQMLLVLCPSLPSKGVLFVKEYVNSSEFSASPHYGR